MDLREASQMTPDQERGHWWVRSRFGHLEEALSAWAQDRQGPLSVLEMGCGTAENLRYLRMESPLAPRLQELVGVDPNLPEEMARKDWMQGKDRCVRSLEGGARPLFDVLIAMDVLEHIGDDSAALQAWLPWLKEGGLLFVSVPSFPVLWSRHDELLGHKRRYTKASFKALIEKLPLTPRSVYYAFSSFFLPVLLARKVKPLFRKDCCEQQGDTDLKVTAPWLNKIFLSMGNPSGAFGKSQRWGTSLMAALEKAPRGHA